MPGVLTAKKRLQKQLQFIEDAIKIYQNKYNYSKVKFKTKKTKVIIICPTPTHNEFERTPADHLKGMGCPKCKEPRTAISYKGQNFDSKESLAKHLGVSRRTLSNRIKAGWPEKDWGIRLRNSYENIEYQGIKYPTLKSLAKFLDIHHRTLLGRIERNWPMDKWALPVEDAVMHRQRVHYEVAEQIQKETRFRLRGLYINNSTPVRFFCLTHFKIHKSRPGNILSGEGLRCCAIAAKELNTKERTLTNEQYDQRIAEFGKAKRLEDYINNHTQIKHLCLIHNFIQDGFPSNILKGGGLDCCRKAAMKAQAERRKEKAASELIDVLKVKNPTIVWVGGKYDGDKGELDFLCLAHDETHPSVPSRVKQGMGLKCCHRAASVKSGKKMGLINGGEHDNVWRALTGQLRRVSDGETLLYLYESPISGYNKYGISGQLERRARDGEYGEQLIEPHAFPERADAVLVEQAFKFGWGIEPPTELLEWQGKSELTNLEPIEFEEIIVQLEVALFKLGRWQFAEEYCDPYEVHMARTYNSKNQCV